MPVATNTFKSRSNARAYFLVDCPSSLCPPIFCDHSYRRQHFRVWDGWADNPYLLGIRRTTPYFTLLFAFPTLGSSPFPITRNPKPTAQNSLILGPSPWLATFLISRWLVLSIRFNFAFWRIRLCSMAI